MPCRAHPSLGERVGLGSPDRSAKDSEPLHAKHLVEGSREMLQTPLAERAYLLKLASTGALVDIAASLRALNLNHNLFKR